MISLLARRYGYSYFSITYSEYRKLPIRVRNRMREQLNEWHAQEKPKES